MHYPSENYQCLYDASLGPLWSQTEGLAHDEDGDHYSAEKDFFEWWYFDAILDNGYVLVAIFHSSLYNAADDKPTLDLKVYTPQGHCILGVERFTRQEFSSHRGRCELRLGNCQVALDKDGRYYLSLNQGEIRGELIFTPRLPGWRPGTGYLFYDKNNGHFFKWVVPVPAADVSGSLELADTAFSVRGMGYHDHNWGNMYLPAAFSHWTWGRVLTENCVIVFGDVVGTGTSPMHVTPFMLAVDNQILLETDQINLRGEGEIREPRTGFSYSRDLHLNTTTGPALELTMTAHRPIEALDFAAPHLLLARNRYLRGAAEVAYYLSQKIPVANKLAARLLGKGSYLRMESQYFLNSSEYTLNQTGRALYEIMGF